ncbi:MAG: RNA polymerase sigma factor [Acidimicrobiia bacterium]|jgi:RNA polymerase sigma-70 factor (ECF subfamily)
MSVPASDDVLVLESLGDPARFAGVFDRHAAAVFAFLARRVGRDGAEDLLGEVFRIAFERRGSYRPDAPSARPWLFGIAANLVHRRRRSEVRELAALARLNGRTSPSTDPMASSAGQLDDRVRLGQAARALERLPTEERDALLLYAWEELTYAEIAVAQDVPTGTVRSRISRARARLRAALSDSTPDLVNLGDDDGH